MIHLILNHWVHNDTEPQFIDIICATHGWLPLKEKECAEIHYGKRCYKIERLPDDNDEL